MVKVMPHISVKMFPGQTDAAKRELTERIVRAVTETTHAPESAVSVTVEDVSSDAWPEAVYRPDILGKEAFLTKKPGYNPLA